MMDQHSERPGNEVENGIPIGKTAPQMTEKEFMNILALEMGENFKKFVRRHTHGLPEDMLEGLIKGLDFHVLNNYGYYYILIPMLVTGQKLPGTEPAPDLMEEYGKRYNLPEISHINREFVRVRGSNIREVINTYQEGFLRKVDPDLCIDYDALSKKYKMDPGREGRGAA